MILHSEFLKSTGVSTNSKEITPGCMFFALKGEKFNGNKYASEAITKGAYKAVIDEAEYKINDDYILVDDVLASLQELARFHRQYLSIPIIGITGTNGKTTTKELTNAVLSSKYNVTATLGNFNNHIGVPLTLLRMNKNTDIGIVEMGANHRGEIKELCKIAMPDIGLVTNVGIAHIEGFGSYQGVIDTKGELYKYVIENNGVNFVNDQNTDLIDSISFLENKTKYFGLNKNNKVCFVETKNNSPLIFLCNIDKNKYEIKTNLIGDYNISNVMAALTIGSHYNISPENAINAIKNYNPDNNRSQLIEINSNKIVMDAYNANPSSMKVALQNFITIKNEKKCLILGEMKELGDISITEHKKLLEQIRKYNVNNVFLIGEQYKNIINSDDNFIWFSNVDELKKYNPFEKLKNNIILIKGSRSNKLEKLI